MSAIAPRSAMSRRDSAIALAQRQARKGNFVRIFGVYYIYPSLIFLKDVFLELNPGRRFWSLFLES